MKKDFFDDSKCFPKVDPTITLPNAVNFMSTGFREYQPETISIPTQELQNIVDALECGLEHTQTVLAEHDVSLGRTTRKNKNWAEQLEKDIEFLKARILILKNKLVCSTALYP